MHFGQSSVKGIGWLKWVFCFGFAVTASAQTRINVGSYPNEPSNHYSLLFAAPAPFTNEFGLGLTLYLCRIVVSGDGYASSLRSFFPGGAVDVMMNNCYSGGFLAGMMDEKPASNNWSFASSAAWGEPSALVGATQLFYSAACAAGTQPYSYTNFLIDDFTRAWREDSMLYTNDGMVNYFGAAIFGTFPTLSIAAILPDPYVQTNLWWMYVLNVKKGYSPLSVSGTNLTYGRNQIGLRPLVLRPTGTNSIQSVNSVPVTPPPTVFINNDLEHPQYASSGPASDVRSLQLPSPNPNRIKQYALLIVWGTSDLGDSITTNELGGGVVFPNNDLVDAASAARTYQTLRSVYNVPADNITVLFLNAAPGNQVGPFKLVAPGPNGATNENLPAFPVNGANTFANWRAALQGQFFTVNGTNAGGNVPGPNDRLFIFNTGHGMEVPATNDVIERKIYDSFSKVYSFGVQNSFSCELGFRPASVMPRVAEDDTATIDLTGGPDSGLPDVLDLVQIATTTPLSDQVSISVDGISFGVAGGCAVTGTDPNYPLYELPNANDDYESDPTNALALSYYQMQVPNSLLLTNDALTITLSGLDPGVFDPNLVAGFIVRGGHQQVAYPVPTQTGLSLSGPQSDGQTVFISWPAGIAPNGYQLLVNTNLATTNWVNAIQYYSGSPNLQFFPNGAAVPMLGNQAYFQFVPFP